MHLSYRPIVSSDLDACWRIAQDNRFYPPLLRSSRTEFWGHLLAAKSAQSIAVEDLDRSPDTRLRAFSLSVFVTDAFAEAARTTLSPGIAGHLHAQMSNGDTPILGQAAIGHANARGGLILFAGPFGYAATQTEREQVAAAEMMLACLFHEHAGYQIKELLLENSLSTRWVASNATRLHQRTDFSGHFKSHPDLLPPEGEHPTLYGLTRQEAFENLESRFVPLFLYTRPQFGFRPGEQRLLIQAGRGGTNEEAAQALSISLSAVKKCWESIYTRVALIEPDLLAASPESEAKRGSEKKNRLLTYLRQHPEEIRPYAP
ncbi:MAG: hypothetical protein ACRYFS_07375 [Janthinobacterium lividum]